jgi:predicted ATP-dependent endonuclease of OLD family
VRFRCRDGEIVDLDELSASERQAVLFGVTFLRSGVHRSLVLIDSPELHQHPSRHADFFASLCTLGRDNQIIAATTSPELLGSVRADQVIDLSRPRA